jgi:outer membrane receptor protein involved in Fe transport
MRNPAFLRRLSGVLILSLGALALGAVEASAQQTAPQAAPQAAPAPAAAAPDQEVLQLSPFEVNVSRDQGYGALQSNSLTSFSMDLKKMPATVQVFTQEFMDDIAATSIEGMLVDYAGTVGYNPNNAGAALDMTGDRNGGQGLGIRGLQASGTKRDGFIGMKNSARTATGNTDNYSVERVELIEGPQSLLYGAVGGGGVVNTVSKRAAFKSRKGSVRYTIDNNSDQRASFDYNHGLDRLAVRVAGVYGQGATERFNLSNQHDFDGVYAQIAWRVTPKITVRVLGERNHNLAVFNNDPNFDTFLPVGDPRRGQNSRYLALTGQLANVTTVLKNEPLTYENFSSLSGWWQSEKIKNDYLSAVVEAQLGAGFSAKLIGMYSETLDQRSNAVNGKNLLPALTSGNPYNETAIQLNNAGFNEQQDRTKGIQFTLLHDRNFKLWRLEGRSQTAFGAEFSHQGPSFGSSGYDTKYYQADENWEPVINPALTQDYGRIPMPSQYWTVGSGIQTKPLFDPFSKRVTINGVNYIAQHRILYDSARVTDTNPYGVIPNNPTTSNPNQFAGGWNPGGDTNNRLLYLANVTDWFDGKLTTVAGVSVNTFDTINFGPTSTGPRFTILPERDYWGYSYGANFVVPRLTGLRFYATLSTAGLSAGTTKDYLGEPLKVPKAQSAQPEIGLKWQSPDARYIAQLSYNPTTEVKNETQNAGSDYFNAVNPDGINGRFNGGDQWINLDREASAAGLAITASPTRNWRMRLSATKLDGKVTSTVQYAQLYNDQFYLNAAGTVTYQNGTPVMVNATNATNGPKDTPLTLAMINDPANPFYADPDPNSGRIRRTALRSVLTAVDPANGQAATHVTGLPISAIQYTFTSPHNGTVTVVEAGNKNTGINEYSFNFQSSYSFDSGAFKGLSLFLDARSTIRNRAYYTVRFPTSATGNAFQGVRELYRMPDLVVYGLGVSYRHKLPGRLGKYTWQTQLNIRNLLDQSEVIIMPNPTNAAQLRARLDAQPRQFVWSNTISF